MSFKITIEETKEVTSTQQGDYGVVREHHAENQNALSSMDISHEEIKEYKRNEDGTYTRKVYDYTPKTERSKMVTTKVYEQTVDRVDIHSVISAVLNSYSE